MEQGIKVKLLAYVLFASREVRIVYLNLFPTHKIFRKILLQP